MRRIVGAALVLGMLSEVLSATPTAAESDADPDVLCPNYELELYGAEQYFGEMLHVCRDTNYYNLALIGWNDVASSLRSAHASPGQGIQFYEHIQYGGASWKLCGNTNRPTLGSWNNRISSFRWIYTCPQ